MTTYIPQLEAIMDACVMTLITKKPSEWYEENMVHPVGSAYPGPHRYDRNPYMREIVDCFGKEHPAQVVAFMKGAQIGASSSVLLPGVGYTISENPANILFMTGHADHTKKAIENIDGMIDACGIRHLIRSTIQRKKGGKTGDTNDSKSFAGGQLVSGAINNHNLLHQFDMQVAIMDDYDNARKSSKQAGSTEALVMQRTAAFASKRKVFLVSTPKLKHESNIEPAFLKGDQRYWHVPCPCCHQPIVWKWEVKISETEKAGIFYKLDNHGQLIPDSVGYVCQKCGGFFTDKTKHQMLNDGQWIPTATATRDNWYSYHVSALYAPVGMFDWKHYVQDYIDANPAGEQDVAKMKTFYNVVLGFTWEDEHVELKAAQLQKNQRGYAPGIVPEKMSVADGNGRIVMLTLAADLNGKEDDARLDYEVVAWSETGSTYSVTHGSIGTFIPREGAKKADRPHWTYRHGTARSVWPELDTILNKVWQFDTGMKSKIVISGIDVGYQTEHVWPYIDRSNHFMFGIKGDVARKYTPFQHDAKLLKPGRERSKLYILETNLMKDALASQMGLKWDPKYDEHQPVGFMNFPQSDSGLYQYSNFFSHFEAEKRVTATNTHSEPVGTKWEKKDSVVQNHLFDCRLYNMAVKDILVQQVCKEIKQDADWQTFATLMMSRRK